MDISASWLRDIPSSQSKDLAYNEVPVSRHVGSPAILVLLGQDMALQLRRRMKAMLASVPEEALRPDPRKSCVELASEVVKFSCP